MKKLLLSLSLLFTSFYGFTQHEGFENWSEQSILRLNNYESSANEFGAYGNMLTSRVEDAVDGMYSIKLECAMLPIGEVAFGYFSSGDPEEQTPGQAVSIANVDSVTGYYKYDILPGDSAVIMIGTSMTGFGTTGGNITYIKGTQATWKRFAYYVGAPAADSLLIAAATGDPLNSFNGIPGSWMMYDNIQLKSSTGATQNIVNHSFENWTATTWENPDGWSTSNDVSVGQNPMPAEKSTDAYSGNYALELNTINGLYGDTVTGIASNGFFDENGMNGGDPYTSEPESIRLHYKYLPVSNDTAWLNIQFKNNGNVVAQTGSLLSPASSYTPINLPLGFVMAPDTFLMVAFSGLNPGSQLLIDHIEMVFPVGINENIKIDRLESYPNPTSDVLNLKFELQNSANISVNLIDITGKVLTSKSFDNLASGTYNKSFNTSHFSSGIYFIEFTVGTEKIVNRFVIK